MSTKRMYKLLFVLLAVVVVLTGSKAWDDDNALWWMFGFITVFLIALSQYNKLEPTGTTPNL